MKSYYDSLVPWLSLLYALGIGVSFNDSAELDTSLCRIVRNLRKDVLAQTLATFSDADTNCAILDSCASVVCSVRNQAQQGDEFFNVGLNLELCNAQPYVEFWSNSSQVPNSWWSHRFRLGNESHRVEVPRNYTVEVSKEETQHWFLTVNLQESHSQTRQPTTGRSKFVALASLFQICRESGGKNEECSLSFSLVRKTRFPLSGIICNALEVKPPESELIVVKRNTETLHMDQHSSSVSGYGSNTWKKCSTDDPFACGIGGTCRITTSVSEGICDCVPGYTKADPNSCVRDSDPVPPDKPIPEPYSDNSSSPFLGGFIGFGILVAVGASIFYGIRYNIFSRLRNRIPLYLNMWPFRRGGVLGVNDQVGMVNPISGSDSDDPPLL